MDLIGVLVFLVLVGILLWAVNSIVPMDGKIKQIFNVVAIVAVVLYLLRAFGLLAHVHV